jgi:hypothetical protein
LNGTTIIGVSLNSGVNTASPLSGAPDSARNVFIGGTYMYGQTASSYGAYLSGADNNMMHEVQFFPLGASTTGYDVYLNQWPGEPNFPLENYFSNLGMTRGISGNGGVGSLYGNTVFPFPTSDGATFPALTGLSGGDHTAKSYVAGVRAYRGRQQSIASLNSSSQTNSTGVETNIPGLSVALTTLASSKLKISFNGRAAKNGSGTGYFVIAVNGSSYGETRSEVGATGYFAAVGGSLLLNVSAGPQTLTVKFASSDANSVEITHGTLIVEELY